MIDAGEDDDMLVRKRFTARTAPTAVRSARRGQKFSRTVCNKSTSVEIVESVIHLSLNASLAVGRLFGSSVKIRRMKSLANNNNYNHRYDNDTKKNCFFYKVEEQIVMLLCLYIL